MPDPLELRGELVEALEFALVEAKGFLESLDEGLVREPGADASADAIGGVLPEHGDGALAALRELAGYMPAAVRTAGPRFFHFVIGGGTPAALAADWLASALDQPPGVWVASPLGAKLEQISLAWLRDLFELPPDWAGVLTTGATMANFTALVSARHWAGELHGIDVGRAGLARMPVLPIFTSGYFHVSATKAVAMAGLGTENVHRLTRDSVGRLDVEALERELVKLGGAPVIVWANAGDVDSGDFDPIEVMAELATRHGAWLHVDGAFGLFARSSPSLAPLAAGIERAQSVIADAHKWLNVPYDCGFAFVHDERYLAGAFGANAPYIPEATAARPSFAFLGPEMSRRARAFAVWATLRAYGRDGYRAMVERHCSLARRVAEQVAASSDLELLAPAQLNVICFRAHPRGLDDEHELDQLNRRIGDSIVADGRILFGTTTYADKIAFRPAISNWRTTESDADLIVTITHELLAADHGGRSKPETKANV